MKVLVEADMVRNYVVTYRSTNGVASYHLAAYSAADAVEQARVIAAGHGVSDLRVLSIQPNPHGGDFTESHRASS